MRRVFGDASARLVDQSAVTASVVDPDDLNAMIGQWQEAVREQLLPFFAETFMRSAEEAAAAFGGAIGFDVYDPRVSTYMSEASNRLVDIGDRSWERARGTLVEGIEKGESISELSARVQASFKSDEIRATTIARTETIAAYNGGTQTGMASLGDAAPGCKQWLASIDFRTRPTHVDADGQIVSMADPFEVGGESLDYPGDPAGDAAEVVNCRCTVLYIDCPPEIESGEAALVEGEIDGENRQMLDEFTPEGFVSLDESMAALEDAPVAEPAGERIEFAEYVASAGRTTADLSLDELERFSTHTRFDDLGDRTLQEIYRANGFDGLPSVVDPSVLDEIIEQSEVGEVWRGVGHVDSYADGVRTHRTPAELVEQFQSGPYYTGRGVSGNGIYSSTVRQTAFEAYAASDLSGLTRMTLRPGARVASDVEITDMIYAERQAFRDETRALYRRQADAMSDGDEDLWTALGHEIRAINDRENLLSQTLWADPGQFAALRGYDAMSHRASMDETYWIFFNRTAIVMER